MNGKTGKNPDREEPFLREMSDLRAAMKNTSNGPRFLPADLHDDPKAAHDALLHWDEQSEQTLRLLAQHPVHGGRLETLQRADGWLRQRAAETIATGNQTDEHGPGSAFLPAGELLDCPPADKLYDFAAGPGAAPLSSAERRAIDRHLATCQPCESFANTLAIAPPATLLGGLDEAAIAAPAVRRAPTPTPVASNKRRTRWGLAIPLAAAAAVLVAVGAWRAFDASGSHSAAPRAAWPEAPLLRGETAAALVWPRGRVLERNAETTRLVPALAGAIPFEFDCPPGSEACRLQLDRTAGGAFDAPERVAEWSVGASPSESPAPLPAGHYTWKAWTRERGLDVEIGSRDFEVVAEDARLPELAAILASGDDDAGVRAVAWLDSRGYRADARVLARSLPATAERDAYLGRTPGR